MGRQESSLIAQCKKMTLILLAGMNYFIARSHFSMEGFMKLAENSGNTVSLLAMN